MVTPGSLMGPAVHVIDAASGEVINRFLAYDINFRGGVRVAVSGTKD